MASVSPAHKVSSLTKTESAARLTPTANSSIVMSEYANNATMDSTSTQTEPAKPG